LQSVLEVAFQRKEEADEVHGRKAAKLNNEILRLGPQIAELEEGLKQGPRSYYPM
jgi:hypothetical protein